MASVTGPGRFEMKLSIRFKFSISLALVILMTVFLLSFLVLNGIRTYQKEQYLSVLKYEAERANANFHTSLIDTNFHLEPLSAYQLKSLFGHPVVIYNYNGEVQSSEASFDSEKFEDLVDTAKHESTAYRVQGDFVYCAAPLTTGGVLEGAAVLLIYPIEDYNIFLNNTRSLFAVIGSLVSLLSFLLGYILFNSFTRGIKRLIDATDRIKSGDYSMPPMARKDELGQLSASLVYMGNQIERTFHDYRVQHDLLTQTIQKLTILEHQQKQFIGNVTHEFKTPLTSIHAYLDLLEMYPDDAGLLTEAKQNIKANSMRLFEMVEKVLTLSALETYESAQELEKTEVSQCVDAACHSLKGKMERHGIVVRTSCEEAYVWADRDNLTTIFLNLIDNAVKYNIENGKVCISVYKQDEQVITDISDTGTGIPPDLEQRIFEPFFTADKERSRQTGGAGLGLTLAQKLAVTMNSRILLLKTGETGSTFRIIIPAVKED
jgi:signal transduction histidine kinase